MKDIKKFIDSENNGIKAVKTISVNKHTIKYADEITKHRDINCITGDEELVRAVFLTKLVNEYHYPLERIELEKSYTMGRPSPRTPRIDVIVKDKDGNAFLFIELKSPEDFYIDQDETIKEQLFNLAGAEIALGNKIKYLVLLTCDLDNEDFANKAIVIDYEKYHSFDEWQEDRNATNEIPDNYGIARKTPYKKGSNKDLQVNFSSEKLNSLQKELHNVLWGGGGTDDNEVFSSLTNLILAKIQDEDEKNDGETYDFQSLTSERENDELFETNEQLFERINALYRRALEKKLNINDRKKLNKSYVIDENKFSLSKLKYAVQKLEGLSLVDGKNSLNGKDILGDFFEGIIRTGFKQSKGQFFTPINIVRFMLWALQTDKLAIQRIKNDQVIPYMVDPSAGSGTFLIEYMKFITQNMKYKNRNANNYNADLGNSNAVKNKIMSDWFFPDNRENRWAQTFIYGMEINFNLGTASKVNMILHGDGSTNIFVNDGLLPFAKYIKATEPNALNFHNKQNYYGGMDVNEQFDLILTNPPFSVELDNDTKKILKKDYLFGDKKNSENLFIERWYQLLRPNGRCAAVLPESVFDTIDNKYIRLFIYKYFKVKAIVSLPQLTFEPFTSTKTSILFIQKKTKEEIEQWNDLWKKYTNEFNKLKTRCNNLLAVYKDNKERNKYPSIKNLTAEQEKELLYSLLKNQIDENDQSLNVTELIKKYETSIIEICTPDTSLKDFLGAVNTWWVFGEVARELNYDVFMAEVDCIGYKRTKRNVIRQPNHLFRTNNNNEIVVDDGKLETVLDYMRTLSWD